MVDLFNEDNYNALQPWNNTFWFCDCDETANVDNAVSGFIGMSQMDCDANADLQYGCTEIGGTNTEVCHLARRKRSTDRFKSRATRTTFMSPVKVCMKHKSNNILYAREVNL